MPHQNDHHDRARSRARALAAPLCTLSNQRLDVQLRQVIDEYKTRGLSHHVCQMLASELEDLHLEQIGTKGLAQRASALDLSIIDGGVA